MRGKILLLLICIASFLNLQAQNAKQTSYWQQTWLGYFNQSRISDRWSLLASVIIKSREKYVKGFTQSIVEGGLNYHLSEVAKLSLAYAYVTNYPDNPDNVSIPERRPWQQFQINTTHGKNSIMQWFRLEERFRQKAKNDSMLAKGYNFNYRFRYNLFYDVPLGNKFKNTSFFVNNELYLNFGKQVVYNYFDQNHLNIGIKYKFKSDNIQVSYQHLFQQLASGNTYKRADCLRILYIHNSSYYQTPHQ